MNKELIAEIEKVIVEFSPIVRGRRCIGGSQFKDLSEAIAKVVDIKLPEKKSAVIDIKIDSAERVYTANYGYNTAIDEVKRLNKIGG